MSKTSKLEDLNFEDISYPIFVKALEHRPQCQKNSISIMNTILKWIECEKEERKKYLSKLLQHVNYAKLTSSYVQSYLSEELQLMGEPGILADIQTALESRHLLIVGGANSSARRTVLKYHPSRRSFTPCSPPHGMMMMGVI